MNVAVGVFGSNSIGVGTMTHERKQQLAEAQRRFRDRYPTYATDHSFNRKRDTGFVKDDGVRRPLPTRDLVPMLNWQPDLFAADNVVEKTPSVKPKVRLAPEDMCKCGCGLPHNNAVSRVVQVDVGWSNVRQVIWFYSMRCKDKWGRDNA